MGKNKINRIRLAEMLRNGKNQRQCAQHFNVTEGAISQARKEININVIKSVALENAHRVVSKNLDTIEQLLKINQKANELLDSLTIEDTDGEKTIHADLAVKVMGEIRGQLKLQLELYEALYNFKEVEAFQQEVLSTIAEIDKTVRDKIVSKLNQKRIIRQAISFN